MEEVFALAVTHGVLLCGDGNAQARGAWARLKRRVHLRPRGCQGGSVGVGDAEKKESAFPLDKGQKRSNFRHAFLGQKISENPPWGEVWRGKLLPYRRGRPPGDFFGGGQGGMIGRQSVPNPQGCVENVFSAGGAEEIFSGNLRGAGQKTLWRWYGHASVSERLAKIFSCGAVPSRGSFHRRVLWQ